MSELDDDLLNSLPVVTAPSTCQNCGAEDWGRARPNEKYEIVMCNKCPGLEEWCPLEVTQ